MIGRSLARSSSEFLGCGETVIEGIGCVWIVRVNLWAWGLRFRNPALATWIVER